MMHKFLKHLPVLATLFLILCSGTWLLIHQRMDAAVHERQRMNETQNTLQTLTRRWNKESKEIMDEASRRLEALNHSQQLRREEDATTAHILPEQALPASLQKRRESIDRHAEEYSQISMIETAVKQKTFDTEYDQLIKALNRLREYTSQINNVAAEMEHHAVQLHQKPQDS